MKKILNIAVFAALFATASLLSNTASAQNYEPTVAWFQQFAAQHNCPFYPAPANYQPSMAGTWQYDMVYLLDQKNELPMEIYAFDEANSYFAAAEGNDKDLWEDAGTGKVYCSGPGGLCGGGPVVCVAVSSTTPY